ncbi:MAG TPA: TonB-dependent receptor [Caulobacteraceae bacterium]
MASVAAIASAVWGLLGWAPASAQPSPEAAGLQLASADPAVVEALVVTGSKAAADEVGGSAVYLDEKALETFSYADVNRVLRQVPGVYLQEEEGFGLRPNIGIRGSGSDRSGRIAVMEDGILIAPAPYAAPAAYYFPRVSRMSGVEVVKGPAAIQYGPLTTGGALQLFSTPIPEVERLGGQGKLLGGYGSLRAHGALGGWRQVGPFQVGGLVEVLHESSEGFKALDSGGDTGFRIDDMMLKLGVRTGEAAAMPQSLELKFQTSDETSDETYVGLTLADFRADPYRRYRGSQVDQMNVGHETWQATHRVALTPALDLTTVAYRTETARAWYKLNDVLSGASLRSVNSVLADPAVFPDAYATLVGAPGYVSPVNALRMRYNNRSYKSAGVQSVLGASFVSGAAAHRLQLSVRYHQDEEDRFQHDDRYQMNDGQMGLTASGAPGSQENRLGEARAWAFFARDTIDVGAITLTPGLRYETIELKRTSYALGDAARAAPTGVDRSDVDVWIPGTSAIWRLSPSWRLIGGVHRGFSNPAPGSTSDPETSWNYEAGVRYAAGAASLEAIAFFNDYRNLIGTCTASTGGECAIGAQFDGGEVEGKGLELSAGYDLAGAFGLGVRVPVSAVYTYTDARFQTGFSSGYSPWGLVSAGFELPYTPEHQLTANLGLHGEAWRTDLMVNHVSDARSVAGAGPIPLNQLIEARTLVDVAAEYDLTGQVSFFASVQNLTDETYNAAFTPAGARPGAPRLAQGGVKLRF